MNAVVRFRVTVTAVLAAGVIAAGSTGARAQGGFGGNMPPEIQAKIKAWQKYAEQHKKVTNLGLMLRQIQEINKDPDYALDKKQSAGLLAVVSQWRNKPAMTEDQATDVQKKIGALLTAKQIQKMSTVKGWGQGGGRPGGGGGFGGGRPGAPMKFPDPPKGSMNPFNPDTMPDSPMKPLMKKGMDDFAADLAKKAK